MEISPKVNTQNKNSFPSAKSILCLYLLTLVLILFYIQISTFDSSALSYASRASLSQWKDIVIATNTNQPEANISMPATNEVIDTKPPEVNVSMFATKEVISTERLEVNVSMSTTNEVISTNPLEVNASMSATKEVISTNPPEVNISMSATKEVISTNQPEVILSIPAKTPLDPLTFLPLKDIRFSGPEAAMTGHTWFMSSINDTFEENESQHLLFPSVESEGRILCIKGRNSGDGTKNSYALAYPGSIPDSAIFMKGLTFVSNTYYNYENLWHGICAMAPFVRWSIKNECTKPTRWVLYHWGEQVFRTGSWINKLMEANYKEVMNIDKFEKGDGPYCFEKAVVMRHDFGTMGPENKLKAFGLLRCKAREFCGFNPAGRGEEVNERGVPIIRLTLLLRRGARSFKNSSAVFEAFSQECAKVDGCILEKIQSEDLNFCEQVKMMMNTDIVASPHGAQLTNMLFMDRGSSIMEFFPYGWLELAGAGQYAHHWLADMSGMKHRGAWWDADGKECPKPEDKLECFLFHKDGPVGQNATYISEWTRKVIGEVSLIKQKQLNSTEKYSSNADCVC